MTNAELMTKSERCGALSPEPGIWRTRMRKGGTRCPQRLQKTAALPPDICAFGDRHPSSSEKPIHLGLGALTSDESRRYKISCSCFGLRHLVIPLSFDIRHSSLSRLDVCATASHGRIRRKSQMSRRNQQRSCLRNLRLADRHDFRGRSGLHRLFDWYRSGC